MIYVCLTVGSGEVVKSGLGLPRCACNWFELHFAIKKKEPQSSVLRASPSVKRPSFGLQNEKERERSDSQTTSFKSFREPTMVDSKQHHSLPLKCSVPACMGVTGDLPDRSDRDQASHNRMDIDQSIQPGSPK